MSSPMTAASHPASDAPPLTAGTTAPTSPSLSLSPLSDEDELEDEDELDDEPVVENVKSKGKKRASTSTAGKAKPAAKRKSTAGDSTPAKKRKAGDGTASKATPKSTPKATPKSKPKPEEKDTYCHQCRTKCDPDRVLRCTKLRKYTKATPARACNLAWCERDLQKRYGIDMSAIMAKGQNVAAADKEGHDGDKDYVFPCPCCLDQCQNATCRKKKGLDQLGDIVKLAEQQGVSVLDLVHQTDAQPSKPKVVVISDDSDLTDPDAPEDKKKATPKKKTTAKSTPKAESKAKKGKDAKDKAVKDAKKATKAKGKDATTKAAKGKDAKGKSKEIKPKETKAKDKKIVPKKPARVKPPVVEPPIVPNMDTKLGRDEVEQRLYLREFLCRFRGILNIPDRALGPLDDFDHPLSEATVRQVGGGLLDVITEHLVTHNDADAEHVSDKREELRHYADLARFAQIYQSLSELLGLELPPEPRDTAQDRNDRAMRALLELGEGEAAPAWATDTGPSRRAGRQGASRIPRASEVVRMLIALVEYAIHTDDIRWHMDPAVLSTEFEARRKLARDTKEETARWDQEKKKIMAARVRCKSAQETKANKAEFDIAQEEHYRRSRDLNLQYRIVTQRKLMRFEPLGTDPEGRVYYSLTPRLLDEERYRPTTWARGVLIWGRGLGVDEALPIERWMHVGTAVGCRALHEWILNRLVYVQYDEDVRRDAEEAAAGSKLKGKGKGKKAPPPAESTSTLSALSSARATPLGRGTVEVVIPSRRVSAANGNASGNALANGHAKANGHAADSDAESDLSDLEPEPTDDLLALVSPEGYVPSVAQRMEDLTRLSDGIAQAALLLEGLELRGIA